MTFGNKNVSNMVEETPKKKRNKHSFDILDEDPNIKKAKEKLTFNYEKDIPTFNTWYQQTLKSFPVVSLLTFSKTDGRFQTKILEDFTPIETVFYAHEKISGMHVVDGIVEFSDGSITTHIWNCDNKQFVYDYHFRIKKVEVTKYIGIVIPRPTFINYVRKGGENVLKMSLVEYYYLKKFKFL